MRIISILLLFFISSFALTLDETKHLLNRTSFGYTQKDIKKFQEFSKEEAIDFLIKQAKSTDIYKHPRAIKESSTFDGKYKNLSKEEKKALRKKRNQKMYEIKKWWYQMIFDSKFSFREKMTLFWHNHFTSEYRLVKSPFMMFEQNMLYRKNALGKFDELLHKSSTDMAMLVYLDSNSNKKSHPNENYARELLELFTLGEGNYSEKDIKEAARAFTGYRVNRKKASFRIVEKHHDFAEKTFMGYKGNFNGEDIINIVLKQDETAKFITMKLYKEFIAEKYNRGEVERLANIFRNSNYDIAVLMKSLLLSEDFWNKKSRATLIKSPVEFIVSFVKELNIKIKDKGYKYIIKASKNLGQELFNPPNVKGWLGNRAWIDSSSLLNRKELISKVIKRRVKKRDREEYLSYFLKPEFNLK